MKLRCLIISVLVTLAILVCLFYPTKHEKVLASSFNSIISTIAGGCGASNVPATNISLIGPNYVALGRNGSFYVASYNDNVVRKVKTDETISTIAGNCARGNGGDDGLAINAQLTFPDGLAVSPDGSVYIADVGSSRIRKVGNSGIITTVAGTGTSGINRKDGPATSIDLSDPIGMSFDSNGNLYFADSGNAVIRELTSHGEIKTIAGQLGVSGFSGDGGSADKAKLSIPYGVAVSADGSIYIADLGNNRIRLISHNGKISTVAGTGVAGFGGDGGLAINAELNNPSGVSIALDGSLYIVDLQNSRIRRVSPMGVITTVVGNGQQSNTGDGGLAVNASLIQPNSVVVAHDGSFYITSSGLVRKVTPDGIINTVAGNDLGNYSGDGGPAVQAQLYYPGSTVVAPDGSIYFTDNSNNRVRKISSDGIITTIAGNGVQGHSGDGGPATQAEIDSPQGITLGSDSSIYFADSSYIRKVSSDGIITTIAGNGVQGHSGDGGPATQAEIVGYDLAFGPDGSLYVTDYDRVRKIDTNGIISTIAGGNCCNLGDGGPATSASISRARGVAVGPNGSIYISDSDSNRVRKVTPDGIISTIVGEGDCSSEQDGILATTASICTPTGLVIGPDNTIYISETGDFRIREVNPAGIINTIAGNGTWGFTGDGRPGPSAKISEPYGIALGQGNSLYFADFDNNRIRNITW